ncbi:pyridoxal phosphate-dependent transferase [Aspergillus transmontanensis]|uniref:Pyridoxal phosphate-dependent transferase n=1 Tax=Aspergillus transmontanensis TaxID=1034304 RepID=A0A5N6WBY8_9EURO|nr:pyridoxal phosphate-dependent transferase [Aspergillus transmontanensis]
MKVKDYNALTLAQPTNFSAMMKSGELLWGTGCRMPNEDVCRIIAALPHDFRFIDAIHHTARRSNYLETSHSDKNDVLAGAACPLGSELSGGVCNNWGPILASNGNGHILPSDRDLPATHRLQKAELVEKLSYTPASSLHPVYETICARIVDLIERAAPGPPRNMLVKDTDVFLYPSGMSAIYQVHQMLFDWRGLESAIVGFPYELTIKMMEAYGPSFKFYSLGTDEQIHEFELYLESKAKKAQGPFLQAVWCECPSNPLLCTVDLERMRRLADQYDFVVIVDETIGTGSVVLNPNSRYYTSLKTSLGDSYTSDLYVNDAIQLEINSCDFLQRAAQLNSTAEYLADYLHPFASDPSSVVNAVHYPKKSTSVQRYKARMRQATDDFTPGYGCLLTVESASVFFDNLDVRKGPSLGAHITLAQPYVQMALQKQKKWAASNGLRETIVRVSVGLEDKDDLLQCVKSALAIAEKTKSGLVFRVQFIFVVLERYNTDPKCWKA